MKPKKLALKKVTVSNLSEDLAKRIYGGEAPTYDQDPNNPTGCTDVQASCNGGGTPCTSPDNCASNNCPSGPGQPDCTNPPVGCDGSNSQARCTEVQCPTRLTPCFTQAECTYTQCTDLEQGCQPTNQDASLCPGVGNC